MHRRCWCANPADPLILLILLMHRPCWCADSSDALMRMMHWCCWCTDVVDALMLLNQDQDLLADLSISICSSLFFRHWSYQTNTKQQTKISTYPKIIFASKFKFPGILDSNCKLTNVRRWQGLGWWWWWGLGWEEARGRGWEGWEGSGSSLLMELSHLQRDSELPEKYSW